MKLILVAAAVSAQQNEFVLPDLSSFDLSSFGLGPNLAPNLGGLGDLDNERYFFTQTTTTPTTTTTTTTTTIAGASCWKCDQMTYDSCASNGEYVNCELGDADCCFVEIRETKGKLNQLCTGCKHEQACKDNQAENFVGGRRHHQCRPDYRLQKIGKFGPTTSVCRQCFSACNPADDDTKCFGSVTNGGSVGTFFNHALTTNNANYPFTTFAPADASVMGIPTWGPTDGTLDSAVISDIQSFAADSLNLYFEDATNAKTSGPTDGTADGTRDSATEMVFWSLHGADQTWWSSNLKTIQQSLNSEATARSVASYN